MLRQQLGVVAQAVTGPFDLDDDGVVQEAVEQRDGDDGGFFCRPSLLMVDEIGYLPVSPGGCDLFSQLVNAR